MDWTTQGAIGAGISSGIETYLKLKQFQSNEERQQKEFEFMEKNWKLTQDKFAEFKKTQEEVRATNQAQRKLANAQLNLNQFTGALKMAEVFVGSDGEMTPKQYATATKEIMDTFEIDLKDFFKENKDEKSGVVKGYTFETPDMIKNRLTEATQKLQQGNQQLQAMLTQKQMKLTDLQIANEKAEASVGGMDLNETVDNIRAEAERRRKMHKDKWLATGMTAMDLQKNPVEFEKYKGGLEEIDTWVETETKKAATRFGVAETKPVNEEALKKKSNIDKRKDIKDMVGAVKTLEKGMDDLKAVLDMERINIDQYRYGMVLLNKKFRRKKPPTKTVQEEKPERTRTILWKKLKGLVD